MAAIKPDLACSRCAQRESDEDGTARFMTSLHIVDLLRYRGKEGRAIISPINGDYSRQPATAGQFHTRSVDGDLLLLDRSSSA